MNESWWTCPHCECENPSILSACGGCDSARPQSSRLQWSEKYDMWKCDKCDFRTPGYVSHENCAVESVNPVPTPEDSPKVEAVLDETMQFMLAQLMSAAFAAQSNRLMARFLHQAQIASMRDADKTYVLVADQCAQDAWLVVEIAHTAMDAHAPETCPWCLFREKKSA